VVRAAKDKDLLHACHSQKLKTVLDQGDVRQREQALQERRGERPRVREREKTLKEIGTRTLGFSSVIGLNLSLKESVRMMAWRMLSGS